MSGTGRIDLSTFTEPLVPAYATDLMVGAEASPTVATCTSVQRHEGRTYFALSAEGFYAEDPSDVKPTGYVWSGWLRYGITEDKVVQEINLRHEPLRGTITPVLMGEDLVEFTVGTSSKVDGLAANLKREVNIGEAAMMRLDFVAGGVNETPVLKRWTVQALPTPKRLDEVILPVVLREHVTYGQGSGQDYYYDTLDTFEYLQGFVGSGSTLAYQEGEKTYRVYLDRLEEQPDSWTSNKRFFNGTLVLRLLVVDEED